MPVTFCDNCNNCMYPREDVSNKVLEYICKREGCGKRTRAKGSQIESHSTEHKGIATKKLLAAHVHDAALKCVTTMTCPACKQNIGVKLLMNPYKNDPDDMSLICLCVNCQHVWNRSDGNL